MTTYNSNSSFTPDAHGIKTEFGIARIGFIQRFEKNVLGKDYFIGDLHGMFRLLEAALKLAGFDPEKDRLFSVGDLIDRGPDSDLVLEWLAKPWFHAVQGNHEDAAIWFGIGGPTNLEHYITWGAGWLIGLTDLEKQEIAYGLMMLPYLIEIETDEGLIGICHADTHQDNWTTTKMLYDTVRNQEGLDRLKGHTLMSRNRIIAKDPTPVEGVYAVLVGHTPVTEPCALGNTYYIDTGSCYPDRPMCLLELSDLKSIGQIAPDKK